MRTRYAQIAEEKKTGTESRPAMTFAAVNNPPQVLMYSDIQPE